LTSASSPPPTSEQRSDREDHVRPASPQAPRAPGDPDLGTAAAQAAGLPGPIERVPWSELGPGFIETWGRPRGKNEPEHVQVLGPSGSGKGIFLRDILLERARRRESHMVFIATKPADKTTLSMGWPVVEDYRGVLQYPQVIYWPRTNRIGQARKEYLREKVMDLLARLWQPDSNTVVIWDELARAEKLGPDVKETAEMYFTEGRALGITNVYGKQRTQGVGRDATGNTDWKITFRMSDLADSERTAELYGPKKIFVPVIQSLDRERFEFLIQHKLDLQTYISWIDKPVKPPARQTGYRK
jgi:hypothetical protein